MKAKFLAIGLLGALIATTAVFADDSTSNSMPAAGSGTQAPAPSTDTSTPTTGTPSGNGQVSQ